MERIPRIIHLCWLSGSEYPETINRCIDSWKEIMPDYEIMLWDSEKFKEIDNRFAREAFDRRKWAFAADYIRLYALYYYGGIYMDSDVRVYKRFDDMLGNAFFSCIEYFKPTGYIAIEAAVIGAEKGHPFVKECLDMYKDIPFVKEDGSLDQTTITVKMAGLAHENWGFEYKPRAQALRDGIMIYPPVTFTNPSGEFSTEKTYALHLCNGSWLDRKPGLGERTVNFIRNYYRHPFAATVNIYKKLKSLILRQ